MNSEVKIIGIINVTPDSFSDGGRFLDPAAAAAAAQKLSAQGADIIEIGGDSTRPGSYCVGPEEEWRRIGGLVETLARHYQIAVDTHHASVAAKALAKGAVIINDVSAGSDREMFDVLARSKAAYVMMYSRCLAPHSFGIQSSSDSLVAAMDFLGSRCEEAIAAGVRREQILVDPGMGAFISDNAEDSWRVVSRLAEVFSLGFPVVLGASRKGFLKQPEEAGPEDRDALSALCGYFAASVMPLNSSLYLRVHNVLLQRWFVRVLEKYTGEVILKCG
jgi:dihydropteroate synthase